VQKLLRLCGKHLDALKEKEAGGAEGQKKEEKKPDDTSQSFAVLGIAMIAMGEDTGVEMSMRQFNILSPATLSSSLTNGYPSQIHYVDPIISKSVALALGLISALNPQLPVLDTPSKFSHDNDLAVALNATFAMGLAGAGTNNARLAQMLRPLAGYYYKEPDCLSMVRIAHGQRHHWDKPFFLGQEHHESTCYCCRRRRPGRQTMHDIRFPNAPDTCAMERTESATEEFTSYL
jgi:26S proteasome regulatory subunit N1